MDIFSKLKETVTGSISHKNAPSSGHGDPSSSSMDMLSKDPTASSSRSSKVFEASMNNDFSSGMSSNGTSSSGLGGGPMNGSIDSIAAGAGTSDPMSDMSGMGNSSGMQQSQAFQQGQQNNNNNGNQMNDSMSLMQPGSQQYTGQSMPGPDPLSNNLQGGIQGMQGNDNMSGAPPSGMQASQQSGMYSQGGYDNGPGYTQTQSNAYGNPSSGQSMGDPIGQNGPNTGMPMQEGMNDQRYPGDTGLQSPYGMHQPQINQGVEFPGSSSNPGMPMQDGPGNREQKMPNADLRFQVREMKDKMDLILEKLSVIEERTRRLGY